MRTRAAVALLLPTLALGAAAELTAQERMLPPPPFAGGLPMTSRAWLGIGFTERQTTQAGRSELVVQGIEAESPAAEAGLQPGDVLVALNDLPLSRDLLASAVRSIEPGDQVRLRVLRDNDEFDVDVTAAERPDRLRDPRFGGRSFDTDSFRHILHGFLDAARVNIDELDLPQLYFEFDDSTFDAWSDDARFRMDRDSIIGDVRGRQVRVLSHPFGGEFDVHGDTITFSPGTFMSRLRFGSRGVAGAEFTQLGSSLARYFPGAQDGLLVLSVAPETPAARAGLEAGDVVARVNERPVRSIAELRRAIDEADEATVRLQLLRDGVIRDVQLSRARR